MFISMFEVGDILDGLNEQQRRAATHEGGPLLVLAGAGTGKTRTLVARAAWLRDIHGLQASRILLLTFTRRAASDMLARAASAGAGSAERICGGTFHAIAHKIIRQHAESFSLPPQFTILDQSDAADLMDVLRPDHGLADPRQRSPRAATCADIYSRCVNTGRPVSEVVTGSFPWCVPFTSQLADLFRAYTARKRARHLVDFDDLLLLWQAALADPAAGPVLRGMFDAVLVDEYQDVNAVQASIVRLLQPDGKQLTCVGDDAQAIYGFRGADPAHLRQLTADYPGLDIVRLHRNYRSRQGVLDLANLIRPSAPGLELTLTGDRGPGVRRHCWSGATTRPPRPGRSAPGCWGSGGRHGAAGSGRAGPRRPSQRHPGNRAVRAQDPVPEVRRPEVHRHRARQGLPGRRADPGQPRRRAGLVPAAAPARRHRPGPCPPRAGHRVPRHGSGAGTWPPDQWPAAAQAAPARSRRALTATLDQLAAAAAAPVRPRPRRS